MNKESSGETSTSSMGLDGMRGWRMAVGIVTCVGAVIAVILWLFFYAAAYNLYQNIAVVGVIFLACMAVMAATMAPWFMKQRSKWTMTGSS